MKEEIWKDIPNYEGYYQVSSLGRVRSLDRLILGKSGSLRPWKGRVLKIKLNNDGYQHVDLSKENKVTTWKVSSLVAQAFLNHTPNGHIKVVDHVNGIKDDDRLSNLRIVTQRQNTSNSFRSDRAGHTSKYVGVCFNKETSKWKASITFKSKKHHLGYYENEIDASRAYQIALTEIKNGVFNN